jgi:hypothetical protein
MRFAFADLTLTALVLTVSALSCSTSPTAPSPTGPPAAQSPFRSIAGDYRLTIDIDDQACAPRLPEGLNVRSYDVVLDDKGWHFLPIRIVDGGDTALRGDLWTSDQQSRFTLRWNDIDVGCDYPDLTGTGQLYVCGSGPVAQNGSTITGVLDGFVFFNADGPQRTGCAGSQRFTFTRRE